jgi:hypothetical protein
LDGEARKIEFERVQHDLRERQLALSAKILGLLSRERTAAVAMLLALGLAIFTGVAPHVFQKQLIYAFSFIIFFIGALCRGRCIRKLGEVVAGLDQDDLFGGPAPKGKLGRREGDGVPSSTRPE